MTFPITEVRAEMTRLTGLLLENSRKYDEREGYIRSSRQNGSHNFSGDLRTVLKNDVILKDLSSTAKTLAAILTAYSTTMAAEIAFQDLDWRGNNPVAAAFGSGLGFIEPRERRMRG